MCGEGTKLSVGANIGTNVTISCQVDAHPAPTSFSWSFNNSKDSFELPSDKFQHKGHRSELVHWVRSELDYGQFYCSAENGEGVTDDPCIVSIIPAQPPDIPLHCHLLNQVSSPHRQICLFTRIFLNFLISQSLNEILKEERALAFYAFLVFDLGKYLQHLSKILFDPFYPQTRELIQVECEPGFDGGLEQMFVLEVVDGVSHITLANVSSLHPFFTVTGLHPGREIKLLISAENKNGRSKPVMLDVFTTKVAQLQVGKFVLQLQLQFSACCCILCINK